MKERVVTIAILGWGSLIWNPRDLALATDWQQGGPTLRVEFSRISNNGRLTLVIDERHGPRVPTRFATSSCPDLKAAIRNLQEREGAPTPATIGFVDVLHDEQSARAQSEHPAACTDIQAWAKQKGIDAVIWTAIGPRFQEQTGEPFSVDAAIRYLAGLRGPTRALALEYIRNAPSEVVTPVRSKAQELLA